MIVNFLQQVISMGGILEITIKMERRIDIHKIRGNHALLQFLLLRGGGLSSTLKSHFLGVVLDLEAILTKTPPIALMLKVCTFRGSFGR